MIPELNTPVGFLGRDGFYWWIGQIEKRDTVKKAYRYKVRIIGQHVMSCSSVEPDDLPWANVVYPVTSPSREGNSNASPVKLDKGDWVIGFFLDGQTGQQPMILGALHKVVGSSTENIGYSPNSYGDSCLAFKRSFASTNPYTAIPKGATDIATTNSSSPGAEQKPPPIVAGSNKENTKTNQSGRHHCVILPDAGCKDPKKKQSDFERVLSEFFASVQSNGGGVGTQILSDVTGTLVDYANAANGYITRIFGLARAYINAAKAELFKQIKKGISALLKICLGVPTPTPPDATGGKSQPQTSSKTGILGQLTTFLNDLLGQINCQIADLEDAILNFLTNLIFGLIEDIVNGATCVVEATISAILSEIESFLTEAISTILGILQAILTIVASPLNILSAALQYIFQLFGISCSGPSNECLTEEERTYCTGPQKKRPGESDFAALDSLIANIATDGTTSLQTACESALANPCPEPTQAYVTGGTPVSTPPAAVTTLPQVVITANPQSVAYNGSTTITWTSTNADSLVSSNFGATTTSGSIVVNNLTADTTYDITVQGSDGQGGTWNANDNTVVFVGIQASPAAPAPTPLATTGAAPISLASSIVGNLLISGISTTSSSIDTTDTLTLNSTAYLNIGPSSVNTNTFVETPTTSLLNGNTTIPSTQVQLEYSLTTNKTRVTTSDTVRFTFSVVNGYVADGTVFDYFIFGSVQLKDFASGTVTGSMTMNNGIATVDVQTSAAFSFYGEKPMSFIVLQSGNSLASVAFTLANPSTSIPQTTVTPQVVKPVLCNVEVDAKGKVMSVGICGTGTPYATKPLIKITGEGSGASVVPVLDSKGYLIKAKVLRPGSGYVPTRYNKNCIIDGFVIIRPGKGYTEAPTIYVDGDPNIVKAVINSNGYLVDVEVINKTKTFDAFPTIEIIGTGMGAKAIPSLGCLDEDSYNTYVSSVAPSGTDSVIDCP